MIKLFYLLTFTTSSLLFGQIELQKTIEEEVSVYSVNGETYYISTGPNPDIYYDPEQSTVISKKTIGNEKNIKIFDKDYNLYKEFTVSPPNNYDVLINKPNETTNSYIFSKGIFDLDDKLDIIILLSNSEFSYIRIYNEDGLIVKDFEKPYKLIDGNPKFFQIYHDTSDNVNKFLISTRGRDYDFTEIYTLPSKTLNITDNNSVTNSLKIYPNPVNSILTIDNPNNGTSEIKVFDMNGKLIKNVPFNTNDKNISLNVSDIIKGNYVVKIGNSVSKIIKN
ncbi:T9SS type A sorting domain-containing protein [Empedobacter falsenii]